MTPTQMNSALKSNSALVSLVGTRIYYGQAPVNTTIPFVSYRLSSAEKIKTLDGYIDIETVTFDVQCTGDSFSELKAVCEQTNLTLSNLDNSNEFQTVFNFDSETELHNSLTTINFISKV